MSFSEVVGDFIRSWPLFATTYTTGWIVAALLALVGVLVVGSRAVFAGAALSQASTLGISVAMWIGAVLGDAAPAWMARDGWLSAVSILAAVGTSLFLVRASQREGRGSGRGLASPEAVIGWIYLLGASGAIIVSAHHPHGLEEVNRLVSSSLIGAGSGDLWTFAALAVATAAMVVRWWRPILLWLMDPPSAAASGVRVELLERGHALWLGLVVGLAIRSSGLLYTFGCLVLPSLVAQGLCRETRSLFWAAPTVAVAASLAGFVLANAFDYPPAQLTVLVLAAAVLPASVAGTLRHRLVTGPSSRGGR